MRRLLFAVLSSSVFGLVSGECQAQVRIDIRVLRVAGAAGQENPEAGTKVWVTTDSGLADFRTTDAQGRAEFVLQPTASLSFRIGDPPRAMPLHRMSGRFNQNTSVVLSTQYQIVTARLASSPEVAEMWRFLNELKRAKETYGLSDRMRREVESFRGTIQAITPILNSDTPQQRQQQLEDRQALTHLIDELLAPPWRLGLVIRDTNQGALVLQVDAGTPAAQAGIRQGELIVEFDGHPLGLIQGELIRLAALVRRSQTGQARLKVQASSDGASSVRQVQVQMIR